MNRDKQLKELRDRNPDDQLLHSLYTMLKNSNEKIKNETDEAIINSVIEECKTQVNDSITHRREVLKSKLMKYGKEINDLPDSNEKNNLLNFINGNVPLLENEDIKFSEYIRIENEKQIYINSLINTYINDYTVNKKEIEENRFKVDDLKLKLKIQEFINASRSLDTISKAYKYLQEASNINRMIILDLMAYNKAALVDLVKIVDENVEKLDGLIENDSFNRMKQFLEKDYSEYVLSELKRENSGIEKDVHRFKKYLRNSIFNILNERLKKLASLEMNSDIQQLKDMYNDLMENPKHTTECVKLFLDAETKMKTLGI